MSDRIELIPVKDLTGKKFCIPNYQRGYRWGRQQVRDLLDDIAEYMSPFDEVKDEFYCLQPLVVCERVDNVEDFLAALPKASENALPVTRDAIAKHVEWEVIDGQQRLTTIHMLLSFLNSRQETTTEFAIRYATREESRSFLEDIANKTKEEAEKDIDFWHMFEAYEEIKVWFSKIDEKSKGKWTATQFKEILLNKVKFIWYESSEDPIKVFTRLNIGKIGLTNSELIKALFLNKSNFSGDDATKIRLRQIEIATRWDQIEATLHDDEFWMFLHEKGYDKPTRIDFIFDLVCELKMLDRYIDESLLKDKDGLLGKDGYRTFRYFNAYFNSTQAKEAAKEANKSLIEMCWEKVDQIFAAFTEWFDDLRLYHYVGFLIDQGSEVSDIYKEWLNHGTKAGFQNDYIIHAITKKIEGCKDLDKQYEIDDGQGKSVAWKTQCRPLLLLHNLQTVINQNAKQSAEGRSGVFYKFPFHLYKTEGWDIEHIDSNSTNELADDESRFEFLANAYSAVSKTLQDEIANFNPDDGNFDVLKGKIESELKLDSANKNDFLDEIGKNKVWNFALLDSHTNRSYGNAIFAAKRRIIIGKDKGKHIPVPRLRKKKDHWEIERGVEMDAPSAFIPPCTRQVFLKYYSTVASSPNFWTKTDAEAYRADIFETLKGFAVTLNGKTQESSKGV